MMKKKLSGSSRPEKRVLIRQEDIIITDKMRAQLKALKDREPDLTDPEHPEMTDWSNAVRGKFYRPLKKQVTIRLDLSVLEWFKQNAKQYQTLINTACIEYMLHHQKIAKNTKTRKKS